MRKLRLLTLFISFLVLAGTMHLTGQNTPSKVDFLNAPVLLKKVANPGSRL